MKLSGKEVAKDLAEFDDGSTKILAENQIDQTLNGDDGQGSYEMVILERTFCLVFFIFFKPKKIFSKQLVGVLLCICVKKQLKPLIKNFEWDQIRVGVMGKMGNKGAIAVSFSLYESQFCFVVSHLAAGDSHVDKRNQDYKTICTKIQFSNPNSQIKKTIFDHE